MPRKRMKPDAYLPFYGADFFNATDGYSDAVILGYLRALWHYWSHSHCEGLPDDSDYLKRICRCKDTEWCKTKGVIFGVFFVLEKGVWHQGRARELYADAQESYRKILNASQLGVKARIGQPSVQPPVEPSVGPSVGPSVVPKPQPMVNQPDPDPDPVIRKVQLTSQVQPTTGASAPVAPLMELPEKFKTTRMVNRWQVWQTHRRGMKKAKNWAVLFNEQLSWLSQFDEDTAHEILSASIRNGWQGLFEPKGNTHGHNTATRNENPRNDGVSRAGPDYGEVVRRKQAATMAKYMAETQTASPGTAQP
jgi:uncharacterized protein YdaU (DUF1376 family)